MCTDFFRTSVKLSKFNVIESPRQIKNRIVSQYEFSCLTHFFNSRKDITKTENITAALIRKVAPPIK